VGESVVAKMSIAEFLPKKKDNFFGDRSVVIPMQQLQNIMPDLLTNDLYITDVGFYPCAKNHYRERKTGAKEHILIYCIDGSGTLICRGVEHAINSNTCFIIPATASHLYYASDQEPWSIYWLHFSGERSTRFESFYGKPICLDTHSSKRTNERIELFNKILTALEAGLYLNNIDFANFTLNSLLATIFYSDTFDAVMGCEKNNPLDRAIFFMQDNVYSCLTVKEIASKIKLSESHLSKLFKNTTGTSPIDYFINMKMQEAVRLLLNKSMRVKEVAFALGYNDPFYFSRCFSRKMGQSPAAFLKTSGKKRKTFHKSSHESPYKGL
jgi:AraC-like DNA-binding protein